MNFHAWDKELLNDPDRSFILDGLSHGFKLIPESDTSCIDSYANDNYASATCSKFKPEIDQLFLNELALGRISRVTTKPQCIHPIGRVPKKDSGKSRPITDCSRPHGFSLNDYIKRDLESFRMNSIDTAVSVSTSNCFYAIVDIESAWRWVPVFPPHRQLQGFRRMFGQHDPSRYQYFVDNRLCFGVSCAPAIFNRLSNAIVRMMARRGFHSVVNYLDDFLIIGNTQAECQQGLITLIRLLHSLGFNVSWKKVVSPSQRVTFLGIELDSTTMSLRLPSDKLDHLDTLVTSFSNKVSASKRQLQSLAGSLNFACHVVHGGRTFLRRVIDCIHKLRLPSHRSRLSMQFRADLSWWKTFLVTFNGRSMMLDFRQPVYFQTDASFHGFGAVCSDDWFAGSWSDCPAPDFRSSLFHNQHCSHAGHTIDPSLRSNINYLELFPILIAVRRWGPRWLNKRICVDTDNTQTMAFINNGTCKNPIAMSWLREIFWISVRYNFHLRSRHLPGKLNQHADRLSRLQFPDDTNELFSIHQDIFHSWTTEPSLSPPLPILAPH